MRLWINVIGHPHDMHLEFCYRRRIQNAPVYRVTSNYFRNVFIPSSWTVYASLLFASICKTDEYFLRPYGDCFLIKWDVVPLSTLSVDNFVNNLGGDGVDPIFIGVFWWLKYWSIENSWLKLDLINRLKNKLIVDFIVIHRCCFDMYLKCCFDW